MLSAISLRRPMALAVLLLAALSMRAEGQITGSIASMADILAAPLTGNGISGVKNRKSIDISFTLPTQLTGPAGAAIPLSFNGNYAGLCEIDTTGVCEVASYFTWNPVTTPSYRDQPTRYKPGRKVYAYDQYEV